ncbi:MAG: transcriptional regulator [Bacteroidetes bacterium]|nr:MAG: transcriptional regulator [Bacteroidota bacterium]
MNSGFNDNTITTIKADLKTNESCIRGEADVSKINKSIALLNNSSESITVLAKILSLTGNETRLKILYLIYKEKDICVCDLSDVLNISVSAISQQLKKLKEGNLIVDNKIGKTIYYSINEEQLETLLAIFIQISKNKF